SGLRAFRAVLGAALLAIGDTDRVERAANNVIANTRQVLHAAATDEHNRVLLQVVADARNVGRDLDPVGEANTRNLPKRRVRLLRGLSVNAGAYATSLG